MDNNHNMNDMNNYQPFDFVGGPSAMTGNGINAGQTGINDGQPAPMTGVNTSQLSQNMTANPMPQGWNMSFNGGISAHSLFFPYGSPSPSGQQQPTAGHTSMGQASFQRHSIGSVNTNGSTTPTMASNSTVPMTRNLSGQQLLFSQPSMPMNPQNHAQVNNMGFNQNYPQAAASAQQRGPARRNRHGPKDRIPGQFSQQIRNRLQSYTRTGQACDRCKIRKIKCDAREDGCQQCESQKGYCFVTDRVTGRTERRGFMRDLEEERDALLKEHQRIRDILLEKGVELGAWDNHGKGSVYATQDGEPEDLKQEAKSENGVEA
ncbi:hypothetical protein G7046_g9967 [Stylonectria norvegica]|nr:hypothetical protein G7046_g9967 [Stylonectria norvegica]